MEKGGGHTVAVPFAAQVPRLLICSRAILHGCVQLLGSLRIDHIAEFIILSIPYPAKTSWPLETYMFLSVVPSAMGRLLGSLYNGCT